MKKYVYLFNEGNKDMRNLLGGKGANLAEMTNMGLPVPRGFTITTEACINYYESGEELDKVREEEILNTLKKLEEQTSKKLGSSEKPLLLSVRSGAPISMPGMMDTILNLGLNDKIAKSLSKDEDSIRFIYDSYRRLIMMFADVVKGKGRDKFEDLVAKVKSKRKVSNDIELSAEDMYGIAMESKKIYKKLVGEEFPEDSKVQLMEAIKAVFRSWNTERATVYRKMNGISDSLGTAVNVQEMVYGNLTDTSSTGVVFSRNPASGENELYGEYLEKAQGEDIVSGARTPKQIIAMQRDYPNVYRELKGIAKILEKHYKDMQDMEFTVENNKLFILQTRNGKRTTKAALKIAVDMVNEGILTKREVLMKVDPDKIGDLLHPTFDENALKNANVITKAIAASPGAASGAIYFTKEDVINANKNGIKSILVRTETAAEDIEGLMNSEGILTVHGGMTSHAAVVARGLGKCCVSGASEITINQNKKEMYVGDKIFKEGDIISLDGTTGKVYEGLIKKSSATTSIEFDTFMSWAKKVKRLEVRANVETARDAKMALTLGAEGLGLCRTEHMFFEDKKLLAIREMIIADTTEERQKALEKVLPYQIDDFANLFRIMNNKIVTIRYLDPPLHEFLPKTKDELSALAKALKITDEEMRKKVDNLKELNPMMGHRGARLAITYPEIAVMQTKAIITAAILTIKEGYSVHPEIMLPLIGDTAEYSYLEDIVIKTANEVMGEYNTKVDYKIGTMVEVPRAAIISDELAKSAQFFSYGTNDLTQMTYGFSRDDAGTFLNDYYDKKIFKTDPFKTIDTEGVGKLIMVSLRLARKVNPHIELGICGEHGGDPKSIEFCHKIGLNYVSTSPYRVPTAILAAAQAKIKESYNASI